MCQKQTKDQYQYRKGWRYASVVEYLLRVFYNLKILSIILIIISNNINITKNGSSYPTGSKASIWAVLTTFLSNSPKTSKFFLCFTYKNSTEHLTPLDPQSLPLCSQYNRSLQIYIISMRQGCQVVVCPRYQPHMVDNYLLFLLECLRCTSDFTLSRTTVAQILSFSKSPSKLHKQLISSKFKLFLIIHFWFLPFSQTFLLSTNIHQRL